LDLPTIFFMALGLSMDAVAVSISRGCMVRRLRARHMLRMAFFFGFFQMLMPVVGWLAGLTLNRFLSRLDHCIAFGLLAFIGAKMIREARRADECDLPVHPFDPLVLLGLAVATSIDALAVGLSFSLLRMTIVAPVLIIGLVTFALSFLAVILGNRFGAVLGRKMEVIGGLILIGIGVRILIQHLTAAAS
jgi:putative Mn2+ efflux pump MntP